MTETKERIPRRNKIITLVNGKMAIVVKRRSGETVHYRIDKKDVAKARQHWWFYHNAYCCTMKDDKFWHLAWELIGKPEEGYLMCYLNGDRTDNRKSNLRGLTWNQCNRLAAHRKKPNPSSGVRGVSLYKNGYYVVVIDLDNKRQSFRNRKDAVAARKSFEKRLKDQILRYVE